MFIEIGGIIIFQRTDILISRVIDPTIVVVINIVSAVLSQWLYVQF